MGLFVFEGWDHYGSASTDMLTRSGRLQWTSSSCAISALNRAGTGKSLAFGQGGSLFGSLSQNFGTIIFGMGIIFNQSSGNDNFRIFLLDGSIGTQVEIELKPSTGQINLYRGPGTTLIYSSLLNQFPVGVWCFFEFKLKVDNTTGTFAFQVNSILKDSVSGLDTQTTINSWVNVLEITTFPAGSGWTANVDDLYINDITVDPGPYPMNDFAGDLRVVTLFAVGNNSVQWTPLAGTNWQEISEVAFDGDTTYNSTTTPGQEDTFNYGALPATINHVIGVQATGAYRKTNASTVTFQQAVISGVTEVYGTLQSAGNNYAYFTDLYLTDPNSGAAWTTTAVNSIKVGYKDITV